MLKILNRKTSVIITWLISYAVILLIPILIGYFPYIEASRILESETKKSTLSTIIRVQQRSDTLISELQRIGREIYLNPSITEMLYKDSGNLLDYRTYESVNILSRYKKASDYIENIYMYFNSSDTLISPYGSSNSKQFYDSNYKMKSLSYSEWHNIINNKHDQSFAVMPSESINSDKSIAFIRTIRVNNTSDAYVNMIITVKSNKFLEMVIGNDYIQNSFLLIADGDNNSLAQSQDFDQNKLKDFEKIFTKSESPYTTMYNTKKYVAFKYSSSETNWEFIYLVPSTVFWQNSSYFNSLIFIAIGFCLLTGFIAITLIAIKNYAPINNLIQMLKGQIDVNENNNYNEYQYIQKALNKTLSQKEEIADAMDKQKLVLKNVFLTRLIKGIPMNEQYLSESIASFKINFVSMNFAVILFYINDCENIFFEDSDMEFSRKFELAHLIIQNVVEELANKKHQGFIIQSDELTACLMCVDNSSIQEGKQDIIKIIESSKSFIKNQFNIELAVSVGNIYEGMPGISESYCEALSASEYQVVTQTEGTIFYNDLKGLTHSAYYYPIEKEQKLINTIKSGEFEKANAILDEIFENNFNGRPLRVEIIRCLLFDLVSTMIKTIDEIGSNFEDALFEKIKPNFDQLLSCENITQMKYEMSVILECCCNYVRENSIKKKNYNVQQIIKYIKQNFCDDTLNVSAAAVHFSMSVSNISRYFKEHTGEGLLDYINMLRIEKAKELLESDPQKTIEEIAYLVGFSNSKTFSRLFKNKYGVNPGKYKDIKHS